MKILSIDAWLAAARALFNAIFGISKAVEVTAKPAEIKIAEHKENAPKRNTQMILEGFDIAFKRLKDDIGMEVEDGVQLLFKNMPEDEKKVLIKLLKARIYKYRSNWKRKKRFRQWFDMLEANSLTAQTQYPDGITDIEESLRS